MISSQNNVRKYHTWTSLRAYSPNIYIVFQDPDDDDEEEMCTCIVSLMQKGRRAMRDEGLDTLTIGFSIYHLADPDSAPKPLDTDHMRYNRAIARSKVFVNLREVSCKNWKISKLEELQPIYIRFSQQKDHP